MIQRIQSVWFFMASVCAFISLILPFYIGTTKDHISSYELTGIEIFYLRYLTIAVGTIAFIIIFLFKKRRWQIQLSVLGVLLEFILIILYYMEVRTFLDGIYPFTALIHGCVIFFYFLALKGIKKDINEKKKIKRAKKTRYG